MLYRYALMLYQVIYCYELMSGVHSINHARKYLRIICYCSEPTSKTSSKTIWVFMWIFSIYDFKYLYIHVAVPSHGCDATKYANI